MRYESSTSFVMGISQCFEGKQTVVREKQFFSEVYSSFNLRQQIKLNFEETRSVYSSFRHLTCISFISLFSHESYQCDINIHSVNTNRHYQYISDRYVSTGSTCIDWIYKGTLIWQVLLCSVSVMSISIGHSIKLIRTQWIFIHVLCIRSVNSFQDLMCYVYVWDDVSIRYEQFHSVIKMYNTCSHTCAVCGTCQQWNHVQLLLGSSIFVHSY